MDGFLPSVTLGLFRGETGIVMPSLVHAFVRTVRKKARNKCWNRVEGPAKISPWPADFFEHLPQLLFRLLTILDIGAGAVPFDDVAGLVAHGYFLVQHPSVLPVCAPHARFEPKWLAAREACSPARDERAHVVSVHRRRPIPALEILQSESNKLEPALVEEVQVPVRTTGVDQRG